MSKKTTLFVSAEVWYEIKNLKQLGDTTDSVLRRVLGLPPYVKTSEKEIEK